MTDFEAGDRVCLKDPTHYKHYETLFPDLAERIGFRAGTVERVGGDGSLHIRWDGVETEEHEAETWGINPNCVIFWAPPTREELEETYKSLGVTPDASPRVQA